MNTKAAVKKVGDYWDMRGKTYSKSWTSVAKKRLSEMETGIVKNILEELAKKRKTVKVLDIGIAIGRICEEILKFNVELYGTDISSEMVKICKARFRKNKNAKDFLVHDIHQPIPKNLGKFDLITAFRVISYSREWKKEIRNVYEVLKPGGIFIFTFPNIYSTHTISTKLIRRQLDGCSVSSKELEKGIKKAGFSSIKIIGFSRLFDVFYDWADSKEKSDFIFSVESILEKFLGKKLFARIFYAICTK